MTKVRSRKVDLDTEAWNANPNHEQLSPYVGHIYQITFDAWTFAKSDLWASLMQTIFFELDRQITLEQQLFEVLKKVPNAQRQGLEEEIWPVLYETNDADRKWFIERVLNNTSLLDEFNSQLTNPKFTGFLWKKFQTSQKEALSSFAQLNVELKKAKSQFIAKKAEIREREHAQFRPIVEFQNNQQAQRIDALLGTSFVLLRQRIGTPLFRRLSNEVRRELQGNSTQRDESKQKGLWKTLNETIQEYEQVSRGIVELESEESADKNLDTLKKEKDKSDELLQKIETTKFDIYNVAATVIDQKYGWITINSAYQWATRNWVLISIFVVFFVLPVVGLVAISLAPELEISILQRVKELIDRGNQSVAGLAALLATLTPGIITFQAMLKTAQQWFEETSLALQEYQKGVENRTKEVEATIEQKIVAKIYEDEELQELESTVRQLESQVKAKQAEMPENIYASLADFVSGRLQEGSYEKNLGLMQQVKQDLSALSDRLLPPRQSDQSWEAKIDFLKEVFPRGPARVIVYIDDLDRCPPNRVVEVLEAVQLLVKTPLFIAVLAIDERYITCALEKYYDGVLSRRGRPSGTDYLEKIIQLPYRVRPIMPNALEEYLKNQVVIQDNATGGTKFSEFSRQEFNMLLECCKQTDLSPRTLKRLTNVYKLFKIVCRTRGTKPSTSIQKAILALLALSGRYPNLMRGIFNEIETCFEENRDQRKARRIDERKAQRNNIPVEKLGHQALHLQTPLTSFFEHYQLPITDHYLQREFDKLRHDALETAILPPITLTDMSHEIFNLVRSFSFVGEVGEDPDDHLVSESAMVDSLNGNNPASSPSHQETQDMA
ncbi:MAG: P-loop NTPase fold protein [Cyanobacteria bacterium P01_E01_bin.6]